MKNKNTRKFNVVYYFRMTNKPNSVGGYSENVYLKKDETEIDLIVKIEEKIRHKDSTTSYEYTEIKI